MNKTLRTDIDRLVDRIDALIILRVKMKGAAKVGDELKVALGDDLYDLVVGLLEDLT